jgi:hypothetical protein
MARTCAALFWTLLLGACSGESEIAPPPPADGGGGDAQPGTVQRHPEAPYGTPNLRARQEFRIDGKPQGVCFADLDGDGCEELVAVCATPPQLHIWSSKEGLLSQVEIPDYPLGPIPVTVGDSIHPTHIALASRTTSELLVINLEQTQQLPLPGTPRAFAVGDLGADGLQEFVIATREGDLVLIDPHGEQASVKLPEKSSTCILVQENGVWVGSQSDASLRYFEFGNGQLHPRQKIKLPGIPRDIYESEGSILVAGGDHSLWRITDDGPVSVLNLGAIPISLAGRGGTLLGVSFTSLTYFVVRNDTILHQEYAGQDAWDGAIGDYDGDDVLDVAFANRDAHCVSLVRGSQDAHRPHEAQRIGVDRGPQSVAAADLNGDGVREIMAVHALSARILTLIPEQGSYRVHSWLPSGAGADKVRSGDLNGDGHPDVLWFVRHEKGLTVRAYLGDGQLNLGPEMFECHLSDRIEGGDILLYDMDGDGDVEALVADIGASTVSVVDWKSTDGTFALTQVSSLVVADAPTSLTAFGDGRFAVAVGAPGPRLGVALLQADGMQLTETQFFATEDPPIDVSTLEFSGPAPLELAVLTKHGDGPGKLIVLGNSPGGWAEIASDKTGLRPYALSTGDIDGDGRDDLVVGAQNSHNVGLWTRTKNGMKRLPDLGAGRGVLDVLLVDLDGDGHADLVTANNFSNDVSVAERLNE